jgi:hypothetical protein
MVIYSGRFEMTQKNTNAKVSSELVKLEQRETINGDIKLSQG